jgi:hypothetical protein
MKSTTRSPITALTLAALALPALAAAQVNPTYSDLNEAVDEARTVIQSERKTVVAQGLGLTAEEEARFWPLYDRYMADMKAAGDLRVKVITDYAANYANLTDPQARGLINDSLKYQEKVLKVRKGYLGKFRKVLPDVKVARFYQIENKLDAITSFVLADEIPLVPLAPSTAPIAVPQGQ